MRLRLDLGYDGTEFHGWATQPGLRTVQGELEAALDTLLRAGTRESHGESHRVTVGGRTDAGVHARGQVAHLDVSESLASRVTARRLNGVLRHREAQDIVVHEVRRVSEAFDARFAALTRRYEYRLRDANARKDPLSTRYTADVPAALNFAAMQRASERLLGLQDFTTFCKAREGATAIRELLRFEWREADDGAFAATIEADAFCHSMVRALVGSIVAVGSERLTEGDLVSLRDARRRTSRFSVMPAHGLSLEAITYPSDDLLEARVSQTRAKRNERDVLS